MTISTTHEDAMRAALRVRDVLVRLDNDQVRALDVWARRLLENKTGEIFDPCAEAGCACPCHGNDADPGPHLPCCAWADQNYPDGPTTQSAPAEPKTRALVLVYASEGCEEQFEEVVSAVREAVTKEIAAGGVQLHMSKVTGS